jgi:hypothetical protein
LLTALNGLGRETSVFAVLAAYDRTALGELASRPRIPGSAVAVLLRPWTWFGPEASVAGDETWQAAADAMRTAGWRVVAAEHGDELADLWPALLSTRAGLRR